MSHAIHRADAAHASHHATQNQPVRSRDNADHEHVVRHGDNLKQLAATYNVPQQAIVSANRHLIVDAKLPLVVGDNLRIPASTVPHAQPVATASAQAATSSHYKETVTLPRAGHDAPPQSKRLTEIVDHLNGYMRPNHAELGNRNRIVHVRGPDAGKEIHFPIKDKTPTVDGNGVLRGTVLSDGVKINYGQRKVITPPGGTPATYVAVIGPKIRSVAGHDYGASGWIPLSALKDSTAKHRYQADLAANVKHGAHGGDAPQRYTLDADGAQRAKYGDLKVNPGPHGDGVPRDKRLAAGDYLLRPGGAVNLLYSLPGHGGASTDTFKANGTEFIPLPAFRARVPLYLPKHPTAAERAGWQDGTLPHTMEFVYGRIGDRYGWIAADALKSA